MKILCYIFNIIYSKWIAKGWYAEHVYGWRSARIKNELGMVSWIQPCFWIFK